MKAIILIIIISLSTCNNHKSVKPLKLINAYEVETNGVLEPSGLTLWDGVFYTVSDKDSKIYKLNFLNEKVILDAVINITNKSGRNPDFEGITHDDNYFYLVSEASFQILKVSRDGKQQKWLLESNNLKTLGQEAGLFKVHNAYIEGICFLSDNKFLLAAERQPRGFLELQIKPFSVNAYITNDAVFEYKDQRSPDFTGLSCDDDMYVLDRNAYVVSDLIRVDGRFMEARGYSYEEIINKEQLKYQDMRYGHAEGLVVKGDRIYIILDNNRNPHVQDDSNNNSLFLEMKK